jgi:hypothetical protein
VVAEKNPPQRPVDISRFGRKGWPVSKNSLALIAVSCISPGGDVKPNDIVDLEVVSRFDLSGYGKVVLVRGRLSDDFPMSVSKDFCLLFSYNKPEVFLLWLANARVIHRCSSDSLSFVGGTEYTRERRGWFKCFAVIGGRLSSVFVSDEMTSNYSLGNSTDGCFNYLGGDLELRNSDANGDGCSDLIFIGMKRIYCTDEFLVDSDKPIREEPVRLVYLYTGLADIGKAYVRK